MLFFSVILLMITPTRGFSVRSTKVSSFPLKDSDDSARCLFIEPDWYYHYRPKGMLTSTDDVLTAYVATVAKFGDLRASNEFYSAGHVQRYVDLGCGIGSCLLLTSHYLQPSVISVGIEVQMISAALAQQTVSFLPVKGTPLIHIENMDLRELLLPDNSEASKPPVVLSSLLGKCDLVTANPPYCPPHSGNAALDSQRLNARFEMHGGIEEYCQVAHRLLDSDNDESRFVFSFWSNQDDRVRLALQRANLKLKTVVKVTAGSSKRPKQYLNIYVAAHLQSNEEATESIVELDIVLKDAQAADVGGGCLSPTYVTIMNHLSMAKRPLR